MVKFYFYHIFSDIIFTSGGTESNNLVLNSAVENFWFNRKSMTATSEGPCTVRPHIISSTLEHDSIKLVLEKFVENGKAGISTVFGYFNYVWHVDRLLVL